MYVFVSALENLFPEDRKQPQLLTRVILLLKEKKKVQQKKKCNIIYKNLLKYNKQELSQLLSLNFLYAICGELLLEDIFRLGVPESVMLFR